MNDKNNQIEEMAKVICQECRTITGEKYCNIELQSCIAYIFANIFYNAGYTQKINDDEVVLSISEVEEFRKDQAEVKFLKKQIQEEARKETAREILQKLRNKKFRTMEWDIVVPWDDIEEVIEEEYGVEVE